MSLELVSFRQQSSRVIQQCFTAEQQDLLNVGMPYLDKAIQNKPAVAAWVEKRRGNVDSIFNVIQQGEVLQQRIQQQTQQIKSSRVALMTANAQRSDVDCEASQATEAYEKERNALTGRVQQVNEQLIVDRRIALLPCINPLLWRIGGYIADAANWGRHALHCMVPVLAVAHNSPILSQTVAQSCSSFSLPAVAQCAATVATTTLATCLQTSFWVPFVAAGAIAFACSRVHEAAQRVFGNQQRLTELNSQLDDVQHAHQIQSQEFEQRKSEIGEQIQKDGEAIKLAEKERAALETEKTKVNADLNQVQAEILGDVAERSLNRIKQYEEMGFDEARKQALIPDDMMNALDAVFLQSVHRRNVPKTIAQGPARPVIAESAMVLAASGKPAREDDGTGLGDPMSYKA